jgi:hypothetical protein
MDTEDFGKRISALAKRVSTCETEHDLILDRLEALTAAVLYLSKVTPRGDRAEDTLYLAAGNRVRPLLCGETEEGLPGVARVALKIETEEARTLRLLMQNATLERRKAAADRAKRKADRDAKAEALRKKLNEGVAL